MVESTLAAFSADGPKLIISGRQTNLVDVFSIAADGSPSDPVFNKFTNTELFGLEVDASGVLLVTSTASAPSNRSVLLRHRNPTGTDYLPALKVLNVVSLDLALSPRRAQTGVEGLAAY